VLAWAAPATAQTESERSASTPFAPPGAQTADTQSEPTSDIVVIGIKRGIRDSIDTKRNSINVVDSIAAEDLGKLPDQNVAESLQRIPGVTISRANGDGQFISVRGLGPQFNVVTLNGRTLATENVGREFSFDVLPSELISGADVMKSPTAKINGASIGATVNIRTVRPLDLKAFTLAVTAQAKREDLDDSWGPSLSGIVSWHSPSRTFGASLVASYSDSRIRSDQSGVGQGWGTRSSYDPSLPVDAPGQDTFFRGRIGPDVAPFKNLTMPFDAQRTYQFSRKKRLGIDGTIQWNPTDNLSLTADGLYSRLNELDTSSAVSYDFSGGTLVDQVIKDGAVTSQKFTGGFVDQIQARTPRLSTTYMVGLNADWKVGNLRLIGDISTSKATRKGNDDTYFSTIRRVDMNTEWDRTPGSQIINMDWSSPNYPNAPTDVNNIGAHYEHDGGSNFADKTLEAKLDGVYDTGGPVVLSFGYAYEKRDKTVSSLDQSGEAQCAFCGGTLYEPLPSSLFTLNPSNWFAGYGNANSIRQWVTYDPRQLVADLKAFVGPPGSVGYQAPTPNAAGSSHVEERVNIGYLMLDFKTELGNMPLAVNTGVRIEDTSFTSSGSAQSIISAVANGQGQEIITLSDIAPISFSGHYTDILPSLNVRLDMTPKLVARFSASRVMTRPTLSDLSPAQSITSNPGQETITRGNPDLKPFRASQAEFGLEWYVDRFTLFSVAVFYKNIDSFVTSATTPQKVDEVTFQVTQPTNGEGATVKGIEVGYRQVFSHLPGLLNGLGAQASFTYADSSAKYTNALLGTAFSLEGLSKTSYSLVGFYEKGPIQARVAYTWRDKFLVNGVGNLGYPVYSAAYGQLDASLSVDVTKNIALTANALNLTNAKEFNYISVPSQTLTYLMTGRRYSVGGRFRF
jgi:TonB-dependent receptor